MPKLAALTLIALLLAACGGSEAPAPAPSDDALEQIAAEGDHESVEEEYSRPPTPRRAGIGETITLTGTNIGVRLRATVTGVERVRVKSKPYVAVDLDLENTGIAVHDDELRGATVSYGDGEARSLAHGVRAGCSHGFDSVVRLDVGAKASGCLVFPASGARMPARFQLALELIPSAEGGIWTLR
jgi:hypothetical protein